jgi:hypothetical protein
MGQLTVVYLDDGGVLLSRNPYASWRDVQAEYPSYQASLGPSTVEEVIELFRGDFGPDQDGWPMSEERIRAFVASDDLVLRGGSA